MPWASFSMLDGPGGTGCDVPVRGCWVSRDVIVAAVYDCVKECMGFVMYLIISMGSDQKTFIILVVWQ